LQYLILDIIISKYHLVNQLISMNIKERFKKYYSKKTKFGLASDILFILLFIALLIPQSRMEIMAFVNKGKMLVMQPSMKEQDKAIKLVDTDYQMVFHDLNGQDLDFSTLKGKVIFMNFWATWCPPCVAEMPAIQELYNIYKDNTQVVFLMVGNESAGDIKKFTDREGYTFPVFINNYRLPDVFSTSSIPTTFVISKSGKIVIHEVGASNWAGDKMKETMEKLIKE
jgi:thiol-disulfide isomerase/thioredoxin